MKITSAEVLKNLQNLIGEEFDKEEINCAFEDFGGDVYVVEKNEEGYDYLAYSDEEQEQFGISVDKNKIILDVIEL